MKLIAKFYKPRQICTKILAYNCIHNDPTPETIAFAKLSKEIEHALNTLIQHSNGCLDETKGYFYASEHSLDHLCQASLEVLEATNPEEPIQFVKMA